MRGWARAFLVLVIVVAGIDLASARTSSNAGTRGVVLTVGDSNVTLAAFSIVWSLSEGPHHDNGYVPVMAARVGSGIRTPDCLASTGCTSSGYWKTKLATLLTKIDPDVVVTDLGINDTASAGTATTLGYASYGRKIDWFMRLIPGGRRVLWTNLPCSIEPPARLTGCRTVNIELARAASRWSNLVVLDWASKASGHPEYMSSPGKDVHLSPAGQSAWARLVTAALDARLPAL
jgi:lysophospholipase L1-like esterase